MHKFRTRLGYKQYYMILTKEQSILTKVMSSFEEKKIQIQYSVLGLIDWLIFSWLQPDLKTNESHHSNIDIRFGRN